jgi:hypothetical protein
VRDSSSLGTIGSRSSRPEVSIDLPVASPFAMLPDLPARRTNPIFVQAIACAAFSTLAPQCCRNDNQPAFSE